MSELESWIDDDMNKTPHCYGKYEGAFIGLRKCMDCPFYGGCTLGDTKESRIDMIGQNGNDGEHYDLLGLNDNYIKTDEVNHPKHYTSDASGIEVIEMTEHMGFCLGNAVKYIKRCELKGKKRQDLEKALWYIQRELNKDV